eukprot:1129045-Amphidinium_carterae.1
MAYIEKHSGMSESSAFWLLYTLIRSKKNRAFKDLHDQKERERERRYVGRSWGVRCEVTGAWKEYFGTEELNAGSRPALCVTSGAHEPEGLDT